MPIVLSKEELARITRWTDANREDPATASRREYLRYLTDTSKQMTKSWPNSLENVNKRNEEVRQARLRAAERANTEFYKRYVRRKKEQQHQLMHNARDTVFKNKDGPKMLLSAVIETCIQKERMEQVKFINERRREAAQRKRKEDDDIIRKAKEWNELNARKHRMRVEADKKYQQEVLEQAHEVAERNRIEYETELEMQQLDNLKANQQIEAIKEFETDFNAKEKARILADMNQAKHEANARKNEQNARDKMDDRLIEVLNKSRARIERKRLETEKSVKAAKQKVLDNISSKLESGEEARAAKEQASMEKAIREKDAAAEQRRLTKAQHEQQIRQERREERERWLRDEARRAHERDTAVHWDCMNRFKNSEIYEEYQERMKQEKARKIKEYREDMLRLWQERVDREARELAETRHFYGARAEALLRDADARLLAHAQDLLDEARAHGRPDYALRKAIDRYCRLHRLYPLPALPRSLQAHYEAHAPQHAGRGGAPCACADRNGLQDPPQANTSKQGEMETKVKETINDDYKRTGRADGLQRRDTQPDLTLPSITVFPCKTETCSCTPKK